MTASRTRSFRRSVVQVAAAFAVLPACGTDAHGTGNPPTCAEGDVDRGKGCVPEVECSTDAPPSQGAACTVEGSRCAVATGDAVATCVDGHWTIDPVTPPEDGCPEQAPARGSACEGELSCDYDSCSNADNVSGARCVDGKWEVYAGYSCNPPPLPGGECPSEPPAEGDACADASLDCEYDGCENPGGVREARCVEGAWSLTVSECNPPEADCPQELPMDGAYCPEAITCSYGEGAEEIIAHCNTEEWRLSCGAENRACDETAVCPEEPPEQGATCHYVGKESCGYHDCGGFFTLEATCFEQAWQLSESSCNPPEVDVPEIED